MALDAIFPLAAVGKLAELGERRERLRAEVRVVLDDVSTGAACAQTRDELFLLQNHHPDRCVRRPYTTTAVKVQLGYITVRSRA